MTSTRYRCFCMSIAILFGALPASAQTAMSVGTGLGLEAYTFSDPDAVGTRTIRLLTAPFAGRVSIGSRLTFEAVGAWARGEVERADGSSATLSGLTDTQLTFAYSVVPDRMSISLVALAPTGQSEQDDQEAEVAGAVAADLIPFRITNWGGGGGIGLVTTVAHAFGRVGAGLSGAYLVGREFDLLDGTDYAYRPGNQLVIRAAIDAGVGTAGKLGLQLTFQQSNDDEVNGSNLYRSGSRYQAIASYAFALGTSSGAMYAGAVHRDRGTFLLDTATDAPAEDLFVAGGNIRLRSGNLVLVPGADFRLHRRANGENQGWSAGVGGSLEFGRNTLILPTLHGRFGNVLVRDGVETGFRGVDLGVTVRFGGR